jgi:hypothetical protein
VRVRDRLRYLYVTNAVGALPVVSATVNFLIRMRASPAREAMASGIL